MKISLENNSILAGPELFASVKNCPAPNAYWWLGQASFIVKMGPAVLLIDPFLSPMEGRLVPPLFQAEDAAGVVDMVLCTHDHIDHIDPVAVRGLAVKTSAMFVAPRACTPRMRELGVSKDRLFALNDGEAASIAGLTVHAIKACHEFFHETADGLFPCLGYVIENGEKVIYHSGDTIWWEGLQTRLARWKFDVLMLPINGRDAARLKANCIGNMVYQEAADLAGGLDAELVVPMHYDMFSFNAENPRAFVDYMEVKYPGRQVWVGRPTERVIY